MQSQVNELRSLVNKSYKLDGKNVDVRVLNLPTMKCTTKRVQIHWTAVGYGNASQGFHYCKDIGRRRQEAKGRTDEGAPAPQPNYCNTIISRSANTHKPIGTVMEQVDRVCLLVCSGKPITSNWPNPSWKEFAFVTMYQKQYVMIHVSSGFSSEG